MDLLGLEIHIPVEAEVRSIPVWSLPNSVLRRMGLPLPAPEGSKALADPPQGIWISPTVIRKREQNPASHTGNSVKENMSTLLYREFRVAQGPIRMSFVSSNCTAYKLLQDIMPGKKVSTHTSHTSLLPHGSALMTHQDAVVIYRGLIYLIVRNHKRSRSQQEPREAQPAAQTSLHSTSAVSSESQEKASLEPADKEPQKKRPRVTLPQISVKQEVLTKTENHFTTETLHTDQELLNDNKPNNQGARRKRPAHCQTRGEQEEVANNDGDECKTQDPDSQQAEKTDQNNGVGSNMQIDSQNVNHCWARRDPQSAASASTSPQQACDFKELEQKEKIARLKAKLRQSEADLNNKQS